MLQTSDYGEYPLCDVAMYLPQLGQPGQGRATYLYGHAQAGMFLPLLTESERNDGARMLGHDRRGLHVATTGGSCTRSPRSGGTTGASTTRSKPRTERLFLQTSEGPRGTIPKLQVVADFLSAEKADPKAAHPPARPRICG